MPFTLKITFKRGLEEVAVLHGSVLHNPAEKTPTLLKIVQLEHDLEELLGFRVHIHEDRPERI